MINFISGILFFWAVWIIAQFGLLLFCLLYSFVVKNNEGYYDLNYFVKEIFFKELKSVKFFMAGIETASCVYPEPFLELKFKSQKIPKFHYKHLRNGVILKSMYDSDNEFFLRLLYDIENWKKSNNIGEDFKNNKDEKCLFNMNFEERLYQLETYCFNEKN